MQRVRMSLPYFKKYGWIAEVVTVDPVFSDLVKDPYLTESIPSDIRIHYVDAFRKSWTSKIGFGNIGYRSIWFYRKYVDELLKNTKFDLIYFSTTQFSVCILGKHWKKKWGIPYVIDIQDMWHSEYYQTRPKNEQPPKYWLSYRLNRYLESIAMKEADGLISVSKSYLDIIKQRYAGLGSVPSDTITFGISDGDFNIVRDRKDIMPAFKPDQFHIDLVYAGRGGHDIAEALELLFGAFKSVLAKNPEAEKMRFHFLGTSYAPEGTGKETIVPIAESLGVESYVYEKTDRIGFYETIASLQAADILLIPGSNDPNYTASKIFPYILAQKPFFAIFNSQSSAVKVLKECSGADIIFLDSLPGRAVIQLEEILAGILNEKAKKPVINNEAFQKYSADTLTHRQTELFDLIIRKS